MRFLWPGFIKFNTDKDTIWTAEKLRDVMQSKFPLLSIKLKGETEAKAETKSAEAKPEKPEAKDKSSSDSSDSSGSSENVPVPDLYCWHCYKPFKNVITMRKHFREFHDLENREPLPKKPKTMARPEFFCEACGAKFSSADSLGHHWCKKAE